MATRTSQLLAVLLAGGRSERGLERLEDDFLVDALLVRDGIDDHQNFLVHHHYLLAPLTDHCGASRAFPISAKLHRYQAAIHLQLNALRPRRASSCPV